MDCRDRERLHGKWYDHFDSNSMAFHVLLYDSDKDEEYVAFFPAKYEVCGLCDGIGSHVNPSIDAHGISANEFYDDPDFADSYFSGVYDVSCYRCNGNRVEPVINKDALDGKQKDSYKVFLKNQEEEVYYQAEREAEIRMGC